MLLIFSERPRVPNPSRGIPVTAYTLLVGNGTVGPLYLETKEKFSFEDVRLSEDSQVSYLRPTDKKAKKKKDDIGRGEEGMLSFLAFHKKRKTYSPGDIIITDNEKSFNTELVRLEMNFMGIEKLNFPIGLGHLMNPCDNEFHSEVKRRYYGYIKRLNATNITLTERLNLVEAAYFKTEESSILKYFRHCGILGNEDTEAIASRLLNSCLYPAKKFQLIHETQKNVYLNWRREQNLK